MMRDSSNGYNAWKELNWYGKELQQAIEWKDEEYAASSIFKMLWTMCNEHQADGVRCAGDWEFLFDTETEANSFANVMELAGVQSRTGYYDPEEDEREGCVDEFTGKWYASWD